MKRLAGFWKQVIDGWTVQRIAAVLIVIGLVVFVFGVVTQYCACVGWPNLGDVLNHMIGDFYANVSVDCLSIAFAILVIDRLNGRRAEQELKAQLIREMGSSDNGIALKAARELLGREWFTDDMLKGAYLIHADLQGAMLSAFNLEEAILTKANLRKATLTNTNLQGANLFGVAINHAALALANLKNARNLTEQQLVTAFSLTLTIMPDGSRYDGRYSLYGDYEESDTSATAQCYNVTLEEYLAGQEWAREHLADLRREAGLDPGTGLPVELINGVEPQPADAPAAPAPRRNGHKASMVTHRVRR